MGIVESFWHMKYQCAQDIFPNCRGNWRNVHLLSDNDQKTVTS